MRKSLAALSVHAWNGSPQRCTSVRFKKIRRLSLRFMLDRRSGKDRRSPALGGRRSVDHGTRVAYQYDWCRCRPCVAAEAEYHGRYAKGLVPGWVDARPARAHLERLRCREGQKPRVGLRRIAALSGLSYSTVRAVLDSSRQMIHPRTAAAILKTRASLADGQTVSQAESYQTRERVRRLIEEEYPLPWLRDRVGAYAVRAAERRKGRGETGALVTVRTWRRVRALYQAAISPESEHHQDEEVRSAP